MQVCESGREGLRQAQLRLFDLIILDIMLPDLSGLDLCQTLRAQQVSAPIMMLTSKSEEIDKVLGLELGADDYVTKPFSIREFMARVKALLRRHEQSLLHPPDPANGPIRAGVLLIDPKKRQVFLKEQPVELTLKEFDLLFLLASNPGRHYSRRELLQQVWGYEFEGYQHTVTAHINRLRTKIEENLAAPHYILTSWGIGYRFTDTPD
ncbi:response regulator transcription factor [Adhaeribacter arboris]|uniref:response regulator transcription factor n=1 Tax=Adhaeribacter arboris TaxID=2072846 RepID=UPI001E4141C6|nr:response regulator transcription factor [Adhaeribacter arboris]